MTEYQVKWEIDIEADSPREAAEKALKIHRDPDSIATVFRVSFNGTSQSLGFPHKITTLIDLTPDDDEDTDPFGYMVRYRAANGLMQGFKCQAVSRAHALDQCLQAHPTGKMHSVSRDPLGAAADKGIEEEGLTGFLNFYRCPECNHEWEDHWSATCEDDCPACGKRHIEPYKSEDA